MSDFAHAASARPHRRSPLGLIARMSGLLRQRRRLADLDDAQLRDIGVSRAEAMAEARRYPWDVPATWRW